MGNGPQCRQMLHRLVGGAVLAHADAVVGEDADGAEMRQRRQSDGRAHVVGEDQERGPIGNNPAVIGHAVHRRAHRVLAHAEMDVASRPIGIE